MPFDQTENCILHRVKDPDLFFPDSFVYEDLGKGVTIVKAKLKMGDSLEIQSIRFEKNKWNQDDVNAWILEKGYESDNARRTYELKDISKVEIFSVGTWNGDAYTIDDLDEMVRAFHAQSDYFRPPLKLGHDDDQQLIQQDGMPAAGWVGELYRIGEKLYADFIDIPEKIYRLLERGAYKKVSSEIYWDAEFNGSRYNRMLAAVALLGSDIPAVSNLNDIMAMYADVMGNKKAYTPEKDGLTIKTYTFTADQGGSEMNEQEKLKADLKAAQDKISKIEGDLSVYKNASDELKSYKSKFDESQKEIEALKVKNHESEVEKQILAMNLAPSLKPYVKALLDDASVKTYSVKVGKEEKKLEKAELIKSMFSLHAEVCKLNTKETSNKGEVIVQGDELAKEIEKYQSENKCTYTEAYKAVCKGKQLQ